MSARAGRRPDPDTRDRPIEVPGLDWEPARRTYIETAIECAEAMQLWWIEAQTKEMRKKLDD